MEKLLQAESGRAKAQLRIPRVRAAYKSIEGVANLPNRGILRELSNTMDGRNRTA